MNVSVTLSFPSAEAAAAALSRLSRIDPLDAPDVGAPLPPVQMALALPEPAAAPVVDPVKLFGTATAAAIVAAPQETAVVPVPPPPVHSTAVAAALPTAPAVPGVPLPPAAPSVPAPPTAPVATAPSVPAAPTSPAGGVERDSSGLPWDARIHAGNKSKNKDGTWRQRRGLNDEALYKRVEAELRAADGAPPAAAAVALPPAPPALPAAPVAAPPLPPAPTGPALATPAGGETFAGLMVRLAPLFQTQKERANTAMTQALQGAGIEGPNGGVPTVGQLAGRQDLIPQVAATFDALMAVSA